MYNGYRHISAIILEYKREEKKRTERYGKFLYRILLINEIANFNPRKVARIGPPATSKILEYFESKIYKFGDDEHCWCWIGSRDLKGYGIFNSSGFSIAAHRYAYEVYIGPIPYGLDIDHVCHNTWCVNPDHLEPVTRSENIKRGYWWKRFTIAVMQAENERRERYGLPRIE